MPHPRNSLKYSEPMTSNQQTGSRAYLFSIVLVAIIGGLLFGYDTAVVSGAEQALDQFFRSAADFTYTSWMHGFTASSALIGCVIGGAISGLLASRFGRKRSLVMAAVLFFISAVGSWRPESGILPYGEASLPLLVSFNIYRILGGIGVLLPFTMFAGEAQTEMLAAQWTGMSALVLLATGFLKVLSTQVCLGLGWRGGHFFPIIFAGISIGYACAGLFGIDPVFALCVCTAGLLGVVMRQPLMVTLLLILCFPVKAVVFMLIAACIGSVIPVPKAFIRNAEDSR